MFLPKPSLFAIVLVTTGCIQPPQYDDEYEDQFERSAQSTKEMFASGYFPESYGERTVDYCGSDVGPWALIGEVEEEWYPQQWMAAREPSFFRLSDKDSSPDFALRFSYIPSFSSSIFIRVQKEGDGFALIAKRMSGSGGYDPGSIASSKKIKLSREEASELEQLLHGEGLFEEPADGCSHGFDGSEWIFELVDPQGYRMVKRWSPTDGAGYDLGQHLLRLTDWNIDGSCLHPLPYPFADMEFSCR